MSANRDLRRACAAAVLCAALALAIPVGVISLLFLAPLAFFLTGFALVAAFFARTEIERPQLILFSVGSSLSVLALSGLVLNYLPGGIRAGWWALVLVVVVLAGAGAAAVRRPAVAVRARPWPRLRVDAAGLAILAAAVLAGGAAVTIAFVPFGADKAIGYTQLWMLPSSVAEGPGIEVGVTSDEQETLSYTLRVTIPGHPAPISRSFDLRPGETREFHLPVVTATAAPTTVEAMLYRDDRPGSVYRRVFDQLPAWATP